ncbi:MAG: protein kinase [Deltaproteobacteria bacterium]|nr:protein kinase [Deltaproteobacteria bacterium]
MQATCATCGTAAPEGARFCLSCGVALTAEAATDSLLGIRLDGRYVLESIIGEGGMGRVYRARHAELRKPVAIKVLRQELSRSTAFVERFRREARAAGRLDSPHSIRVLDSGQTPEGVVYLVMELFVSENLAKIIGREGTLRVERAVAISSQVLSALEGAHRAGILHRDLKPENVLVALGPDLQELAKVCDYGIAKLADEVDDRLTVTGSQFGTPLYMSPESHRGEETDARSDLYSVGAILYEMLTGSPPFDGPNPLAIARAHAEDPPVPVRQRAPLRAIGPDLEAVAMRALAKRRADRYETAEEMRLALERAAEAGDDPHQTARVASLESLVPEHLLAGVRAARLEATAERRDVSVLTVDLAGAELPTGGPGEIATTLLGRYEAVARTVRAHGGIVERPWGDRLVAFFGARSDTSDAGDRAIGAAATSRREAVGGAWFRAAIAAGSALVRKSATGDPEVIGEPVARCRRMLEVARAGVLVVDETLRHTAGRTMVLKPVGRGIFEVTDQAGPELQPATAPLTGRPAELEAIAAAAGDAISGRGRVVLIVGDVGIGKTALLRESLRRAEIYGMRTVRVSSLVGGGNSLTTMSEVVRRLYGFQHPTREQVLEILQPLRMSEDDRRMIADHFAQIETSLPADVARRELTAALRVAVTAFARENPIAIAIEDLQWLDHPSAVLIGELAAAAIRRRLLLIVTSRRRVWSDWDPPHLRRIVLGPVDAAAGAQIVGALVPEGQLQEAHVARLVSQSGGSPMYLSCLVSTLRHSGALAIRDGQVVLQPGVPLPDAVRALVEARLAPLPDSARRALPVAAVLGPTIPMEDLLEILGGGEDAAAAVRILGEAQILLRATEGHAIFREEALREAVYEGIGPEARRALHRAAAEQLLRAPAGTHPDEVIAMHLAEAGELLGASRHFERAAQAALGRAMPGQAAQYFSLARRRYIAGGGSEPGATARLWVREAEALFTAGSTGEAISTAEVALSDTGADAAVRAAALLVLGRAAAREGKTADAEASLAAAIPAANEAGARQTAADAYAALAEVLTHDGQSGRALQTLAEGLQLAEELAEAAPEDDEAQARHGQLLLALGQQQLGRGAPGAAVEYFRSALLLGEKAGDALAIAAALGAIAAAAAARGNLEGAMAEARKAAIHLRRAGDRMAAAKLEHMLGEYAVRANSLDDAMRAFQGSAELAESVGWAEGVAAATASLKAIGGERPRRHSLMTAE